MKFSDAAVRDQMVLVNSRMQKRFWLIGGFMLVAFAFCVVAFDTAVTIARWIGAIVPSVGKLSQSPTRIGLLPAAYFGVLAALMPVFVAWLAWGNDPRLRWRHGAKQTGRGSTEFLLMLYLLGMPFCVAFLYFVYVAPLEIPDTPRLWGQHAIYLMLNTHLGLLVLGTIAALGTVAIGATCLIYLLLPFVALFHLLFKGED